jgi:hypothetical protein
MRLEVAKRLPMLVLEALEAQLKPSGFKLVKSGQRLTQVSGNRTNILLFAVLDDRGSYRISPSVCIRFEQVENIYHRTSGFEPEYQKGTHTLGIDLPELYGKGGYELPLNDETIVDVTVWRLMTIFRKKAEPYYKQFSTLFAVDAAFNDEPLKPCVHAGMPSHRCSVGAIVAKLTGRKNYDELVSIYHGILEKDNGGFYLPAFEALLNDLKSVPAGSASS